MSNANANTVAVGEIDFSVSGLTRTGRYVIQRHQHSNMPAWANLPRHNMVEGTTGIYSRNDLVQVHFDDATPVENARIVEFRGRPTEDGNDDEEVFFVVIQWLYARSEVADLLQESYPRMTPVRLTSILDRLFGGGQYVLSNHYQVLTTENLWGLSDALTLGNDTLRMSDEGMADLVGSVPQVLRNTTCTRRYPYTR